ncbi:hypothetical protein PUN28_008272 [Cardiocondyla obscurior]|uniref:Uncharacterized protein n=1 Tax=Cardiocondyla obscurior TaxID=286306 RepID=A0AAW2FZY5_9HYME
MYSHFRTGTAFVSRIVRRNRQSLSTGAANQVCPLVDPPLLWQRVKITDCVLLFLSLIFLQISTRCLRIPS